MISQHRLEIEAVASALGIPARLIEALVFVESGDNPWAWNPEPRYRYLWNVRINKPFRVLTEAESASDVPPADFPMLAGDADQEWWGQQASWGLMQVMGAVAREQGYMARYLTALCDPQANLVYGSQVLRSHLKWANGDREQALAAYNGGRGGNAKRPFRNQAYAKKVLETVGRLT